MAGALPDDGTADLQMMQQKQYIDARNSDQAGGALPTSSTGLPDDNAARDDQGNAGVYSPQDQRTLALLDNVRGQLAPKHTGNAWAEGYGQVAEDQYKTLSGILSANAKARAAMMLQNTKNQGSSSVANIRGDASKNVAQINAVGRTWTDLTPEEIASRHLPPGTEGQINGRGEFRPTYRPSSSQVQATGVDAQGNAVYAQPGQVITPQQRSQNEKYINAAQSVLPYLDENKPDSLFSKLQDPGATSALGGPGMVERGAQGIMGFFGQDKSVAPADTDLRAEISGFNRQAMQLYKTVPGNENMSPAQLEAYEKDNLPDPDSKTESRSSAFTKMNVFKRMLGQRLGVAQNAMSGQGGYAGNAAPATGGSGNASPPGPDDITPEQAQAELDRRAKAGGN